MNNISLRNAYNERQIGNVAEAARLCSELRKADQKHADALCMIALVYAQLEELDKAAGAADEALHGGPGSARASHNLGYLSQNLSRHKDAIVWDSFAVGKSETSA